MIVGLGSVLGVLALGSERLGLVALRRVPSPIVLRWSKERSEGIAIINTDTTPGVVFVSVVIADDAVEAATSLPDFGFTPIRGHVRESGLETRRVWVPERSIVLVDDPKLVAHRCRVLIYDIHESVGVLDSNRSSIGVPRGMPIRLEWQSYSFRRPELKPDSFFVDRCLVHPAWRIPEGPGVVSSKSDGTLVSYDCDGSAPVVADIDSATRPEIAYFEAFAGETNAIVGECRIWAYPPDMQVIDLRAAHR